MTYTPSAKKLARYADILVNFALGRGKGIKKGDVVYLQFETDALPLALECYKSILQSGGHPIVRMIEESFSKVFYDNANDDQLEFFPEKYSKALVDTIDHRMFLMADRDPFLLKSIPPEKLMKGQKQKTMMKKWLFEKEDKGGLTWTLALYGTEGMAREAGLSLEEFWQQIEKACYLNVADPRKTWIKLEADLEKLRQRISNMPIAKLHITAKDTDLWIGLGDKRKFLAGGGHNIPSFELFTSPDWRQTEGHIYFDYPLYRYGNLIQDIRLEFKAGKVISAKAGKNQKLIQELVRQKNADKVGEYSLTDIRFSKINKFMANTLFDENYGGKWGNTHLALGSSYHEAYTGDVPALKDADWEKLGFNESPEHTDIIATTDRVVEAHMRDGSTNILYSKGKFH